MPRSRSSSSHSSFHAQPSTIEQHAGQVDSHASQVDSHAQGVGGTSLSGDALGTVGSGLTGSMAGHYQRAGTAVSSMATRLRGNADTERGIAGSYRDTEQDNADRFTGLEDYRSPSPTPVRSRPASPTPGASTSGASSRPPVSSWAPQQLPGGSTVYHATDHGSAASIVGNGIRPAQDPTAPDSGAPGNQWGGGELGSGFYTHTNQQSAENYTQNAEGTTTLEYQTTGPLHGSMIPAGTWAGNIHDEDYRQGNDYLTKPDDPNELKFHDGANSLRLTGVWMSGQRYSPQDYKDMMGIDDEE